MKKRSLILLVVFIAVFAASSSASAASKSIYSTSKARIATILELTIAQQGQSELRFGDIRPSAIDSTEVGPMQMAVAVQCNSGTQYQVSQAISGGLVNANGTQMPAGNLKFTSSPTKTTGTGVGTLTPMTGSSQIIFISDANGTSDTVLTDYYLTVPPNQEPGDYSANITYTVSAV